VRVLVAPDKFKGSLTAAEAGEALGAGIRAALPTADVRAVPVADGGEGTLEAAIVAGHVRVPVTATGPTGEPVQTAYARSGDVAVVEMADVSGLARLPGGRLDPLRATSRGTGEVMAAAILAGCRRVVLGIGGSASTDGGAGLVQALGARLVDHDGRDLGPGGAALSGLGDLDLTGLTERMQGVEVVVACDVNNPLTGRQGAAAVYGPQKGASPEDVALLDTALGRWADTVAAATGRDLRDVPGAGAAGGVGFAAVALLGAALRPGVDLLLDLVSFEEQVQDTDWVIVGEGSLDAQSLHGKAPVGVAARARAAGARVLAVCGRCEVEPAALAAVGIEAAFALADEEPDPSASMARAADLLERLGHRLASAGYFS
jgi:glycerate kinase